MGPVTRRSCSEYNYYEKLANHIQEAAFYCVVLAAKLLLTLQVRSGIVAAIFTCEIILCWIFLTSAWQEMACVGSHQQWSSVSIKRRFIKLSASKVCINVFFPSRILLNRPMWRLKNTVSPEISEDRLLEQGADFEDAPFGLQVWTWVWK